LINEANLIIPGRAYWFLLPSRKNGESHDNFLEQWSHAPLSLFNEQWSHPPLLQCLFIFFIFLKNQ